MSDKLRGIISSSINIKDSSQFKRVRQEPLPVQRLPANTKCRSHFSLVITQLDSSGKFWFNINKPAHYETLNLFLDDMNNFYTDWENGVHKVVHVNQVPHGTVAATHYQKQGYHRVLVVLHMNKSNLELFYIDLLGSI